MRQRVARTSAAPGKTRLANVYRIARGTATPFYVVDLPGYGYARGGSADFVRLVGEYFEARGDSGAAVVLTVDARHPGLQSDIEAWHWLCETVERSAVVATKIDKLASGERIRAMRELESVFGYPVLPVSSVTGEGLDELWILIDTLVNKDRKPRRSSRRPEAATAPRPPTGALLHPTGAPRRPKR
jgi:GTP-binding protein